MGKKYYDWNKNFNLKSIPKTEDDHIDTYSDFNMKEAKEYLGLGRKSMNILIENGVLNPTRKKSNQFSSRFSYYFNAEELAFVKLTLIMSNNNVHELY